MAQFGGARGGLGVFQIVRIGAFDDVVAGFAYGR
jgi:hypothetical protein